MKKKILVLLLLTITILITLGGASGTEAARICSNCKAGNHVKCPNRGYTFNSTSHSIWCCCGKTFANAEMHYNSHYLNDSTYCYICVCGYKEKHNTKGGHCNKPHCQYSSSKTLCNRGCNHTKWTSCRNHSYSSSWSRSTTHHWKKCVVTASCTAKIEYNPHEDKNNDGKCDTCEVNNSSGGQVGQGGGAADETVTSSIPGNPVITVGSKNFNGTAESNVIYTNSNIGWKIETLDSISHRPLRMTEYELAGATTGNSAISRAVRYNKTGTAFRAINWTTSSKIPSSHTIEFWIYIPMYHQGTSYIFHTGKVRNNQIHLYKDGQMLLRSSTSGAPTTGNNYITYDELVSLGFYKGWSYVSVQVKTNTSFADGVQIWINGKQATMKLDGSTKYKTQKLVETLLFMGGYYSNSNIGLPDGSMLKEVKVMSGLLASSSASRMYSKMVSGVTGYDALLAYYPMEETSGSTAYTGMASGGVNGVYTTNTSETYTARDVSQYYSGLPIDSNSKFSGTITAEGRTRITANHIGMNGATAGSTVDVVIDKTAPTGTIFASTYNTNQNSVTLYVTASDDSGISGVNINGWFGGNWSQYNSSKSATYNNTTGQWEVTYNFSEIQNTTSGATNQGQGIYYFDAHIYDNAGNWGIASAVTVAYDTQAPWITGAMSVEGLTGSEPTFYTRDVTSTVTLKSTGIGDNLSGPSHFDYYIRRDGAARTYDYNYEQAVDEDTGTGYVKYKLNGQGRYVSEKYIYDRAGNCAACGEITIIADHDGPWILSGSVEGATLKDDGKYYVTNPTGVVTLNNWDMGDNLSGLSHFDYYLSKDGAERTKIYNAGTAINIGTDSSNTTAYVKYKFNGYGTYTTERYIYDKAGNLSACGPITFVVAPESSQGVIYTSASLTNQPTVTVSVAATDESSGVANVIIYGWKGTTTEGNNVLGQGFVGGNATYNSSTGRWDRTFTFNDLPDRTTCEKNQGDGVYAFDAHIINNAGTDTYISPVNVTYDSTAPTVVGITYNPGWKKEPVTINVHFTDALSGVNLIEYSYDLNSWYSDWDSGSGSNVTKTWSEEGDRVVYFRATDYAGNTWIYAYDGTNPSPYDLKIDKTLPNGTVSASTTCTNQNSVTIYVNATDALSGVDHVKMMAWTGSKDWVKTNTEKSTTFNSTTGLWEVSFTFDEIRDTTTGALSQGDGNYYFGAHIYDKAGNRRIVDGTAVIYDTTPPQITSITYDPGWKKVDITKEIEATDTLSGVKLIEYSYDLTTWYSDWESSGKGYAKRTWTEEGDRVVYFRATDNAGNTWIYAYDGTNPSAYDLKIDKTKPVTGTYTVSGTTFKGGKHYVTSETAEITLNFTGMSDNLSGLKLFDVYMKKDGADRTKDYNVSYSINGSTGEVKYKLNGYGTYVTEIYLYDNAGNLKTCLPALTINAVESLPIARLMERESYEYVSGKYVYYAIGAKRSNNKTYTADLISSITFVDNVNVPNEAEASWDASYTNGDNKVIAWVIPNTTDSTKYDLYIGADDITIVAPANPNGLFREYKNCTAINNLTMLDTSNVTDMSSMFENCSNLPSLDVSNFDTSKVTSMSYMFYSCSSLTSLDVSNFNTSNVTDMSYMFDNCSSLTSLDVSNFNTSQVTNMNHMFNSCRNLPSLDVSNFNTSKVTNMSSMFYNCSSLPSLDVSNFNTSNVTDMGYMFYNCRSLTSLDVSNFDTSNVTDMGYMFYNCRSLTSLDVSTFDTSKVTDMNSMFDSCRSLPSLDVSNFDTSKVTDMRSMFFYCSSLTSLDVSNFNTSNVTNMGFMFNNCSSLSSLDVSNFDTSQVKSMGSMFYGCRNLKNLDLRSFDTASLDGKTSSGSTGNVIIVDVNYMFASCSNLESIVFGNNFNRLDGYDMFKDCSNLKAIITTKEIISSGNAPTLSGTENVTNSSGKIIAGPNGLIDLPNAILYVPNTTSEAAYEAATNYTTVFGADRIRPILELAGDNPVKVSKGATYVDSGVTVAGMTKNADGTTYTPYGYTVSGPVIKKDGTVVSSIDTSTKGTYTYTYTVKDSANVEGMSVTRDVIVKDNPTLMQREDANSSNGYNYYAIGAYRTDKTTTYTAAKIKTINIIDLNTTSAPASYEATWDASYTNGDNTVTAWLVTNAEDTTLYDLYLGAEGKIYAPSSSQHLFGDYSKCTEINGLANLDTSKVTNMSGMFFNCSSLPSLEVSNFDTSKVMNMSDMFYHCRSLPSLDVSNFDTSKVMYMSSMFANCSSLPSLDVSNFDTSQVKSMGFMFYYCSSLTSLDVSKFNTSNVTDMSSMFYNCWRLPSLEVSSFDTSRVTNMSWMFANCSSLPSLEVSSFNTSNVTSMYCMFSSCGSLTDLDVTGFDTSKVTDMRSMFSACSSLTSLDVSGFNTSNVTSMYCMFSSCGSLTDLDVTGFDTSKVTDMRSMFSACSSLTSLKLGTKFDRLTGTDMFYNCSKLKAIITPRDSIMTLNDNATTSTGLKTLTNIILYVSNPTVEASFEADTNYADIFGADRIRPILELIGDNPVKVSVGSTYVDAGVTVAGMTQNAADTTYTPYGYTVSGPVIKKDGTVVSSVNTSNVGTYTLTYTVHEPNSSVDGMSVIREVEIESKDISENNPDITVSIPTEDRVYKDAAYTPVVTVKDGTTTLVEGMDYSVSYSDNINAGMATVTIKGINNYTGTRTENFMITQRPVTIKPKDATKEYDTLPLTSNEPEVTAGSLVSGHTATITTTGSITNTGSVDNTISTLTINKADGTDVTANYNVTKAKGTLTITSAGSVTFDITLDNDTFEYDGTAKTPTATVKVGTTTLKEGTDYDVSYKNNKDAGTATITITGKGNYDGSIGTKEFTITKRKITIKAWSVDKVYDGMPLTSSKFEITSGSVPSEQTLTVTTSGSITNVGTTSNKIATYKIIASNEDVTKNYDVTTVDGTLKVTPATITGSVKITGQTIYGETLTAEVTTVPADCTLTYNWYYSTSATATSGTSIGTGSTLALNNTTYIGKYVFVKVTANKANYNTATFTDVTDASTNGSDTVKDSSIVITTNPSNLAVKEGVSGSFSVVATGTNLKYQWYKATSTTGVGTAITGATGATYSITAANMVRGLNGSYYYCTVSNGAGSATSTRALLTVYYAPSIKTQPIDQNVNVGTKATFTIAANAGNPSTTTYKWQYRTSASATWADCTTTQGTGMTTSSFTTVATTMAMNGYQYRCIIGNAQYASAATSNAATLTVKKLDITPTVNMTGYTYGGTKSEPSVEGNTGNGTVTYYYNTTNSNSGGTLWSTVSSSTSLNAGKYYMYAVIGATTNYNEATTATKAFTIAKANGYVNLSATTETAQYGTTSKTFTVTSHHGGTLSAAQTTATGATTSISGTTVTIASLGTLAAGTKVTVRVTSAATVNYNSAYKDYTLTITAAGSASFDITLDNDTFEYDGTAKTPTATVKVGTTTLTAGTDYDVSYKDNINSGTATVTITGKGNYAGSTGTKEFTITKRKLTIKAWSVDKVYDGNALTSDKYEITSGSVAFGQTLTVTTSGSITNVGTTSNKIDTYKITVKSTSEDVTKNYDVTTLDGTLKVAPATITGSVTITGTNTYGQTLTASVTANPTGCTLTYNWYYSTSATATSGTSMGTGSTVMLNNTAYLGKYVFVTVTASKANYNNATFSDRTDSANNGSDIVKDSSIVITTNPSNLAVKEGVAGSFSVAATGTNLKYQWYKATSTTAVGTAITGATSATYSITAANMVRGLNGSYYYCTISNDAGSATSTRALLTVYYAPSIKTQPTDQSVNVGTKATFTIVANAGNPSTTTYKWQYRTSASGAWEDCTTTQGTGMTTSSFTTVATTMAMNGYQYRCIIGNAQYASAATSNAATLTVKRLDITPTISMTGYTYGGTKSEPSVEGNTGNGTVTYYYNTTNSNANGTLWSTVTSSTTLNAGTYYMYAVVSATTNYNGATTSAVPFIIAKRAVTIKPKDASKVYDTLPLTSNEAEVTAGSLVSGHTATITTTGSITSVGSITNTISTLTIKNASGTDVTANYNVTKATGKLTITSASVDFDITLDNDTFEYDGTEKEPGATIKVDGKTLVEGTDYDVSYKDNKDAGTATITITGKGNYEGSIGEKTFEITKRAITVKANDASKAYDTLPLTNNTYTITSGTLAQDHTMTVTISGTITDVGSVPNTITNVVIKDTTDRDVTVNYNITKQAGTLTITPAKDAKFDITLDKDTFVYDGTAKTPTPTVKVGTATLVKGTDYDVSYKDNVNAGTATVTITGKGNYAGAIGEKTFTITKANITPTVNMSDYVYGGTKVEPSVNGNTGNGNVTYYYNTSNSNSNGTNWTTVTSSTSLSAGTYYMYAVIEETANYKGATTPTKEFRITSIDISENNPNVTATIPSEERIYKDAEYRPEVTLKNGTETLVLNKDYTVTYTNNINAGMATITITGINNYSGSRTINFMISKRPITIKPKDVTKVYDRLPLTSTVPEVTAGSLVFSHEITLTTTGTITNVGTVENTISTLIIKDASGTDVTSNYDITKGVGTLTVTEADNVDFDITLDNDSFVYDGTQKEPGVTIKVNGATLEEGKDYDVSYKNNKDAGTATVTITGKGNYEGSSSTKDFTITKRPLEITAGSASKVYNGTALTSSAFSITSETSLAPDQTLSVTTSGTITNVGTTSNVIATYTIYHNGENVTANYSVTLKEGTLEVKPATITGSVIITGTNRVGKTLTAEVTVNPSDASLTYAWYYGTTNDINNATVITGANAKTYSPTTDKIGMYIFVKVTASKENYNDATFTDITDNENNKVEKVGDRLTPYLMAREVQTVTSNGVTSEKAGYAIGAYRAGKTKYTSDLIKSVTIINLLETNAPTTYEAMWDASRDENEAVYAWTVKNQTNSSMYDLYIGGEGTLVLTNGKRLFADYTKCDNINGLNKMNSTNVTDMSYMFSNLASMSTLDVSVVNTSSVTNMEGMFMTNNLTTLNVSGFDTSKVTNMSKMFKESSNLTSLNINGFNTANTNNMSQMFMDCGNITSLNVSAFNTSNVTNMSAMFMGMSKIETLNVTNFNTANVTDMSSMFASCLKVQRLDLHTFNTAKVTNISGMFTADSSMKSVLLGEEFNKLNGSNMFTGCSSLKAIIAQKKITASSEAMTLSATGTGLNTLTNATLYVPNLESKGYYETATNYATVFGEARVKPILEIIGANPVHVTVGAEYVDQGARVAGFEESEATEYTVYGYTLSVSGLPVDTSTVGTKLVIYTVKYKDQVVVTGATW